MLFTIPITDTQAQGIRKKINGVLRKTKTEINRTNRDVKRIKKTLSPKKKTINPALDTADVVKWQKEPYIPNSGMINKYQHVFSFLHKEQELSFANDPDSRSIIWDSLNNIFYKNSSNDQKLDEDVEVMGWHPHWLGDAYKYYNYNLLSIISYYSYDIDPTTGENWQPDIIDQLRNSSLPDSAAANGVRAFISVTSLTEQNNKEFLSNEAAQYHFTGEILKLLNEKKGKFSGIDLNFEEIRPEDKEKFTNFVKVLSAKLKTEKYSLILDVPFIDQRGVYEFAELQEHVEYFNIMGYDFNGEFSPYPGSVAPLHGLKNQPSLETAVNDILLTGVLAKNVILTLPLYGVTWDVTNIDRGEVAYFDSSIPHYDIVAEFGTKYDPYYDPFSVSYFYYTQEGEVKKMCWFENETSLDLKFKWLKEEKGLKGTGLWALGYAKGDEKIWRAVSQNFCIDSLSITNPVEVSYSGPYGLVKDIVRYKKVIGFSFMVFSGFLILGFVMSLTDWRVREILFQKQSFRIIYSVVFVVFFTLSMKWWLLESYSWYYVLLPVVTAAAIFLINLGFTEYRRKLR